MKAICQVDGKTSTVDYQWRCAVAAEDRLPSITHRTTFYSHDYVTFIYAFAFVFH